MERKDSMIGKRVRLLNYPNEKGIVIQTRTLLTLEMDKPDPFGRKTIVTYATEVEELEQENEEEKTKTSSEG